MKSDTVTAFAATRPGSILEWDSQFFGVRIARLDLRMLDEAALQLALEWARRHEVKCLYYLAPADDDASVRCAEKGGFHLVDVRIDFTRGLNTLHESAAAAHIRPAVASDVPALRAIAARGHGDTRFAFDPRFPRERVELLYEEWIRRSCEGYAQQVLVATVDGLPSAYVSCHLEPDAIGRIGLVGVQERMRGRGLGSALVDAALRFFASSGCTEARVATQARNIAAQRLYQNQQFVTREVGLWYHLWF